MKNVLRGMAAVLLVVVAASSGIVLAQDERCGAADALKAAKLYDEALATYGSLLVTDKNTACAHASIADIIAIRQGAADVLVEGKAYEATQQKTQAIDAYARALAADPELVDAREALLALTAATPHDTTFAAVYALSRAGFHDDAAAKLKETVSQHPSSTVPPDLKYLVASKKSPRQWLRAHGKFVSWMDIPSETLALGGAAVASLLFIVLRRWPRRVRMDIEDLVEGTTKDASGGALSGRLEEALFRLWTGPSHPNLQFVEGPAEGFDIPADVTLPAQVKLFAAVLDWLFPPNLVIVGGYLQQLPDRGAGITLRILQKPQSGVIETVTVWQDEFSTPLSSTKSGSAQAFDDLVEPAALWVLYRLSERTGHIISPPYPEDWRSHAAFRAGVRAQKRGDVVAASRRYNQAVRLGPDHLDARINLAILEADQKKYDRAIARLQDVQARLKKNPDHVREMRWYIVRYQLAASYDYAEQPVSAEPEARVLLNEIDATIVDVAREQEAFAARRRVAKLRTALLDRTFRRSRRRAAAMQRRERDVLFRFLRGNRSSIVVMYATILKENGKSQEAQDLLAKLPTSDRSALLAYNLACYHSEAADELAGAKRAEELNRAREFLIEALEGESERAEEAERDPSLEVLRHEMGSKFQRLVKAYK